jgi:hypothetical protein
MDPNKLAKLRRDQKEADAARPKRPAKPVEAPPAQTSIDQPAE